MTEQTYRFESAKPIWERGKSQELHHPLRFTASVPACRSAILRITGYTGYQVFLNGNFVCYGPARAGHGFYRVDEIDLSAYLTKAENDLTVLATGYCCGSFAWLKQPSFLCAEIVADDAVILPTGGEGWHIFRYSEKRRKIQRYSYQRPFGEAYDLRREESAEEVLVEICEEKRFLARGVPYETYDFLPIRNAVEVGNIRHTPPESLYMDRAITLPDDPDAHFDGFRLSEMECPPIHVVQSLQTIPSGETGALPQRLESDRYILFEMERNSTGFLSLELTCHTDADVYLTFDEILTDGKVDFTRLQCSNVVLYRLRGGERYRLLSAEPYTLKYLNVLVCGGAVTLHTVGMREVAFPCSRIRKSWDRNRTDAEMESICRAALETFRQNVTDIYMDCPSRERAGWLCDSFFTGRVEHLLTGESLVERAFLSDFAMVGAYPNVVDGMLPMCYPADFNSLSSGIPNWAMWFLLELKEYAERSGDRAFVADLRPKMEALLGYFRRFENADGLLERLPGWVFVEWSHCNDLTQDINYPTNMLYCRFKQTMAELYGMQELYAEAAHLREMIRKQSRMELFFCDNSVYGTDGVARLSGEATETCQYYAFFTGVATPEEDGRLWQVMLEDFGPKREQTGAWREVAPSNAFIGNYLRLELLSRAGRLEELDADIRGYFSGMAERTGTLWEHDRTSASCDHGFASHVLVWLDRLGYLK